METASAGAEPMSVVQQGTNGSASPSVLSLIEAGLRQWPSRIAVLAPDRELTFRELDAKANAAAAAVLRRTRGKKRVVGVLGESSPETLAAFLGIWKAGCAYLPLDPQFPANRTAYMVQNAGCNLVLVDRDSALPPLDQVTCIPLEGEAPEGSETEVQGPGIAASDLAYVIYTSGTTGNPKGVMIEHGALLNRLVWMQAQYPIAATDVVLQKAPLTFDVSVWELFWAAMVGASVRFLSAGGRRDPARILDAIEHGGVTVLHFVPSLLRSFTEYLDAVRRRGALDGLKYVFCSGEQLLRADVEALRRHFEPGSRARIVNLYGPTEAAIDVSHYEVTGNDPVRIPIGKAIDNLRLYVLNEDGSEVEAGEVGELCIAGVGLARGYIQDPTLTATRFVETRLDPGGRLYRSGDSARVLPDGNIAFLGRQDGQMKINGVRVEPGEIEDCVLRSGLVSRVALVARERQGRTHLVAYVVPDARRAGVVRRLCKPMAAPSTARMESVELADGMTLYCRNRSDAVYLAREIFDRHVYARYLGDLPPRACVFDVGANVGMFSVSVREFSEDPVVYSFEPVPETFEILERNCFVYDVRGKCINVGLSRRSGEAWMTYYPNVASMSSYYADGGEDSAAMRTFLENRERGAQSQLALSDAEMERLLANRMQPEPVKTVTRTLSQIIAEHAVDHVDLLKIDVEKAELDVLLGIEAEDWRKIDRIVLEVHDLDNRLAVINALLGERGYHTETVQEPDLEGTGMYTVYARSLDRVASPTAAPSTFERAGEGERYFSVSKYLDDLREHLRLQLPGFMVPSLLVPVDDIPLSANGKADLSRLPTENLFTQKEEPRNEVERQLRVIWSDLLGTDAEAISIDDNFFLSGGHSLTATSMVSMIIREFGVEVPVDLLFEKPTIRTLAERITTMAANCA